MITNLRMELFEALYHTSRHTAVTRSRQNRQVHLTADSVGISGAGHGHGLDVVRLVSEGCPNIVNIISAVSCLVHWSHTGDQTFVTSFFARPLWTHDTEEMKCLSPTFRLAPAVCSMHACI